MKDKVVKMRIWERMMVMEKMFTEKRKATTKIRLAHQHINIVKEMFSAVNMLAVSTFYHTS